MYYQQQFLLLLLFNKTSVEIVSSLYTIKPNGKTTQDKNVINLLNGNSMSRSVTDRRRCVPGWMNGFKRRLQRQNEPPGWTIDRYRTVITKPNQMPIQVFAFVFCSGNELWTCARSFTHTHTRARLRKYEGYQHAFRFWVNKKNK